MSAVEGDEGSRSVIWVAFGYDFLLMAIHSARTVAECTPSARRILVTNVPIEGVRLGSTEVFHSVTRVEAENNQAFRWKLSVEQYAQADKCIFLDADTEVRRDLCPVFRVLDHYPFAICPRERPSNKNGELWGVPLPETGVREFNSGVFGFNRAVPETDDFFMRLRNNHEQRGESIDQPSFMVTIYEKPEFPVAPLSIEWNATNRSNEARAFVERRPEAVGIYHYRDPHRFADVEAHFLDSVRKAQPLFTAADQRAQASDMEMFEASRASALSRRRGSVKRMLDRIFRR